MSLYSDYKNIENLTDLEKELHTAGEYFARKLTKDIITFHEALIKRILKKKIKVTDSIFYSFRLHILKILVHQNIRHCQRFAKDSGIPRERYMEIEKQFMGIVQGFLDESPLTDRGPSELN